MDSIKFSKIGDFCVYTKENHGFYESIFQDFLKENLKVAKTYKNTQNRQVLLVERGGGHYILKVLLHRDRAIERFIKFLFRGDYHLGSFRAIQRIRNEGCCLPNDFYLLAEKRIFGFYPKDFVMIYEYIKGEPYHKCQNQTKLKEQIKSAVEELHSHNFVLGGDINGGSILLSRNQIRFIDIEGKLPSSFNKAEDRISMEKFLGIPNTKKDYGYFLASLKRSLRKMARKIKGKA